LNTSSSAASGTEPPTIHIERVRATSATASVSGPGIGAADPRIAADDP
jgi:hypothetical protein